MFFSFSSFSPRFYPSFVRSFLPSFIYRSWGLLLHHHLLLATGSRDVKHHQMTNPTLACFCSNRLTWTFCFPAVTAFDGAHKARDCLHLQRYLASKMILMMMMLINYDNDGGDDCNNSNSNNIDDDNNNNGNSVNNNHNNDDEEK